MENGDILMLEEKKDPDHSQWNQQIIRSPKSVLVLCPAESVAKAENKEATAKPENIEAVAKVKNPGEGKC
jgi:hypothetical protein